MEMQITDEDMTDLSVPDHDDPQTETPVQPVDVTESTIATDAQLDDKVTLLKQLYGVPADLDRESRSCCLFMRC